MIRMIDPTTSCSVLRRELANSLCLLMREAGGAVRTILCTCDMSERLHFRMSWTGIEGGRGSPASASYIAGISITKLFATVSGMTVITTCIPA